MRLVGSDAERARLSHSLGSARSELAMLRFNAAPGRAFKAVVPVDARPVEVTLVPQSVRAPGFKVLVQQPGGGWAQAEPGPDQTFVGISPQFPTAQIVASVDQDGMTLQMRVPGLPGAYWLEPIKDRIGTPDRAQGELAHAAYHSLDLDGPVGTCAGPLELGGARGSGGERGTCAASVCVAEIGCDSDSDYFDRYGSVDAVRAQIERVIAHANLQFAAEVGIRHKITTILVRPNPGPPYTSFNAGGVLFEFQSEWNSNQASVPRDVAHLFTAKPLSGGNTVGLALRGTVCNQAQAYSIVRSDCCGSFAGTTDLTAHELGHNWDAAHCACQDPNPISTMNPTVTSANTFVTDISGASVASITNWRNSAACLEPDKPSTPPGSFGIVSPPNAGFGVPLPITLDWADSSGADFYVVSVALQPQFNDPLITAATLSSTFTLQGQLNSQGLRYYWKVTAWNAASQQVPMNPAVASFVSFVPPPACPGDVNTDGQVNTSDLTVMLGSFGSLVTPGTFGDINGDGTINTVDLTQLLSRFGTICD